MIPSRARQIVGMLFDGLSVPENERSEASEMFRSEPELRRSVCSEFGLEEFALYELLKRKGADRARYQEGVRMYHNSCNH